MPLHGASGATGDSGETVQDSLPCPNPVSDPVGAHSNLEQQAQLYASMGFALVPIPYRSKAPNGAQWQHNTITDPESAAKVFSEQMNIGLEHGKSQTGALDIDSDDAAIAFAYVGLDLETILAYPTVQVRGKNGSKPLYDLTGLERLPYFKLTWPHPSERLNNGRPKHYTVLELRAGPGKQDVLPPSLHPDGMFYTWEPEPPTNRANVLPPPPELLSLWQDAERLNLMRQACPWREVEAPTSRPKKTSRPVKHGESVIDAYNASQDLRALLERYGYKPVGRDRYLPPESSTGLAGAVVYTGQDGLERVVVHNASSLLCQQDALGVTRGVTAFGVWLEYEHSGDITAAVKAAAAELGVAQDAPPASSWGTSSTWGKPSAWGATPNQWGKKCR